MVMLKVQPLKQKHILTTILPDRVVIDSHSRPQKIHVALVVPKLSSQEDITNIIILGANDIPKENKANNDKDYMTKAKENHVKPNNKNPLKTPKTPMRTTPKASSNFSFGEASNADVHSIYALENERLQIEHEHRVKNMAEIHSQIMVNLKLQTEILMKTLESLKNK
ncbi:uncharacterized protein LOC123718041 isoform X2 [Pieris brassicae]|uniref:uncharacterized protein LOC123718041 isoform X2 n=1 Tax=Pieris brassicae TaxID=7116 RepID=UPI001E6614A5|nr:uncharacterized protein LOC123718041 isoform X2 [Pieris brassicae]